MRGRTWAEIDLDRLSRNYHKIKDRVGKAKVLAAIKADAYGHGAVQVAQQLEKEGIDFFGVAGVEEGIELRESGIETPIVILSPVPLDTLELVFNHQLIPTISESAMIDRYANFANRFGELEVHVEVDTGMTRTGFSSNLAVERIKKIVQTSGLKLAGVFSHFAVADEDKDITLKQLETLNDIVNQLKSLDIDPPLVHIANSFGLLKYPYSHLDLVRPGLALYGLVDGFEPIMSLKSKVVNLRKVKPNTGVSYGLKFKTKRESTIATVSAGYGDGVPRAVSTNGQVLINGKRASIVGVVCMDLFMVDVTDVEGVSLNDDVIIIGQGLPAYEVAGWANTIVYELVTNIGPRVPRFFYKGDRLVEIRDLLKRRILKTGGSNEKAAFNRVSDVPPLRSGAGIYRKER